MKHRKASKKHVLILFFSLLILLGGLLLTLNQSKQQQTSKSLAAGDCAITSQQQVIKQQEQTLFDLINNYRTENGKGTLTWNPGLKIPAAWLSKDMLTSRNLSHTDSLGRTPEMRFPDCGIPTTVAYGENIANGAPSARDIFDAWKASAPHNAIMLNSAFTQGAISMEVDSSGEVAYWTLDVTGSALLSSTPTGQQPTANLTITTNPSGIPPGTISPTITESLTPSPSKRPGNNTFPTPTTGPIGVDVQLQVSVRILGIGSDGNKAPKSLTRRVTANVYGVGEKPVATGNAFLTWDGSTYFKGVIHLGKLSQGSYFVKLSTDNSLAVLAKPEFQNLMIDRVNEIPAVTLYQGDVTRDNVINIEDYQAVLPCFQDKRCDQAKEIDFNDDGLTDVKDYNLLLRSFGQQPGN